MPREECNRNISQKYSTTSIRQQDCIREFSVSNFEASLNKFHEEENGKMDTLENDSNHEMQNAEDHIVETVNQIF